MKLLLSQKYFHSSEMNDLNWSFLIFVVVSQVNKNESICVKKYEEKNIKLLKEKKKTKPVKILLTWNSPARNQIDTNYITDSK